MADLKDLTFEQGRAALALLAKERGEWAGIPIPIDGEKLRVHPSYPWAAAVNDDTSTAGGDDDIVNLWFSKRILSWIAIAPKEGRRKAFIIRDRSTELQIRTLGVSCAWDVDAEVRALDMLRSKIEGHKMIQYFLTGSFLEGSQRSGIRYMFRRLRPTIAFSDRFGNQPRPLCALCLHPIGYYENSWAGALTPTDDVIAHLTLMRGDEHAYWKWANQIPIDHPEAGL